MSEFCSSKKGFCRSNHITAAVKKKSNNFVLALFKVLLSKYHPTYASCRSSSGKRLKHRYARAACGLSDDGSTQRSNGFRPVPHGFNFLTLLSVSWEQDASTSNQAAICEIRFCNIGRFDEVAYACGRQMLGAWTRSWSETNSATRKQIWINSVSNDEINGQSLLQNAQTLSVICQRSNEM